MMRQYIVNNITKFTQTLNMMDASEILASDDPQIAFYIFHKSYIKIYDQCFPMRKKKINYPIVLNINDIKMQNNIE